MILLADSGSTKTDWCVADGAAEICRIATHGTNPFFPVSYTHLRAHET